jgi:hypothetical protein
MPSSSTHWLPVCVLAGAACGLAAGAFETPSPRVLTPERFTRMHSLIKPHPDEDQWAKIPWRASLWQARRQAAKEGKPILLWEMDGHPLGCT